jgi:hypothetical protein
MSQLPTDGKCQRCRKKTNVTSMSIFNMEHCCIPCLELEKKHPEYKRARKVEYEAVSSGNYNFPGIGLPAGYHEWAKEQS